MSGPSGSKPTRQSRSAAKRRRETIVKLVAPGVAFVLLPHFVDNPALAAAFKPLAMIGWLLLAAAGVLAVMLRFGAKLTAGKSPPPKVPFPSVGRQPQRFMNPAKPRQLVERIEPTLEPFAFERTSFREQSTSAPPPPMVERPRPTGWGPEVFSVIEWRRFEVVVEALFAQAGFRTQAQSHGPDEGVDVWLYSRNQPDGAPVSVVQCKHWQGKRVGVDKVRELRGVMASRNVSRGQFATTSSFTPDAVAFGRANSIKLHDMTGLLDLIGKRTPEQQQALLEVALDGDYWRPTCVNCGTKMVDRPSKQAGRSFWGCANFPGCRTTMVMRATR